MVAHQPSVGGVIGQRRAAPGTLRHMAALPAKQHPAAAPAVQKEDALLSPFQVLFQLPPEVRPNEAGIPGLDLLAEIGDKNLRETLLIIPAAKQLFVILPRLRRPGRLNGRRSGAQKQQSLIPGADIFGNVPCMIPGRIFRKITALLLLVQNNNA